MLFIVKYENQEYYKFIISDNNPEINYSKK